MTPTTSGHPTLGVALLATSAGGAAGAVLRWSLSSGPSAAEGHFPTTTFALNVAGSVLLATLPLLPVVRRRVWLALFLGTGVLGGFTTMSAASVDTFVLLDRGDPGLALAYSVGTLACSLLAVLAVDRFTTSDQRREFEEQGGDE